MDRQPLTELLNGSQFRRFLEIDPTGVQLPSFIATVHESKPAMDLWVRVGSWESFERLVCHFGLHCHVDAYFDRHAEEVLTSSPRENFTTTRAVLSKNFTGQAEAHVFVASAEAALIAAVGAGWYPLVVDGRVVEKHLADHEKFGAALGYPSCCREFFRKRNDWFYDNTYYAAYLNTVTAQRALSNGLLRHTAFSYTPHMACSFSCDASMDYGARLREVIAKEAPAYGEEIDRQLASPMLCLSELHIYRFEGSTQSTDRIDYETVEPINPTTSDDPLFKMLSRGDACRVDANIVSVQRRGVQIDAYVARADKHGPEFPFIIRCT
jgi:hypothetical protein